MKKLHLLIILAAVFCSVAWFLVWPAAQNIFVLRQEMSVWQLKLEEALTAKNTLAQLEKTYQDSQEAEARILEAIPNKGDLPSLLIQLEAMASQNGLILNSLDFVYSQEEKIVRASAAEAEVAADDQSSNGAGLVPAAAAAEPIPPSNVSVLEISLNLSGNYAAMKNFLKAVENNLRLSDVTAVNFSQPESGSGLAQGLSRAGQLSIGLNVYYKK